MNAPIETLTPTEAAVVAGVSVRDVHRIIDEHILPDSFFVTQDARSFKSQACVFISFYFGAADRLTSEERQRTIAIAIRNSRDWTASTKIVKDGFLSVDFAPFWNSVDERLLRLRAARALVIRGRRDFERHARYQGNARPGIRCRCVCCCRHCDEENSLCISQRQSGTSGTRRALRESESPTRQTQAAHCSACRRKDHLVSPQAQIRLQSDEAPH